MKHYLYLMSLLLLFLITPPLYAIDIPNHNFEKETENWIKTANTVAFSINTTDAKEATGSAEIMYVSSTSHGIRQPILNIDSSKTYRISSFVKATTAKKALIRIAWYQTGSTNQMKTDDSPVVSAPLEWTPLEFIVTPPSGATSAELRLLVSEGIAYFDNISMEDYVLPSPSPMPTSTITLAPSLTITPTLTPTSISILFTTPTATPTPSYNNIFISEVFVYPESGFNEWIELYNGNPFPVTLTNWYIDDTADSGSLPKLINSVIPANSYTVIEMTTSLFNNEGDSVRLLDFSKITKDSFEYDNSQKNNSIGKSSLLSNVVCIQAPTKGSINGPCLEKDTEPQITTTPTPITTPHLISSSLIMTPTAVPKGLNRNTSDRYSPSPTRNHSSDENTVIELPNPDIKQHPNKHKITSFLAASYSLLSFISIGVKMIIARH